MGAVRLFGVSSYDPKTVNRRLALAAETHNLVSPAREIAVLPAGYEVQINLVTVDTEPRSKDVFPGEDGELLLTHLPLKAIARQAGIEWLTEGAGRLAGPKHPHYCRYRAVARFRDVDSTFRKVNGEVEVDVREGSKRLRELAEHPHYRGVSLERIRARILPYTVTLAQCRAIREFGVKASYSRDELRRGFAVVRIIWTGRTRSKTLRRELALRGAEGARRARETLYGGDR